MRRTAALLLLAGAAACASSHPSAAPPAVPTTAALPASTPMPATAAPPTSAAASPTPTPTSASASPSPVVVGRASFARPQQVPSPAPLCTHTAVPPKALHMTVDDVARVAYTAVPSSYGRREQPVVIALHGYDQQATYFADYTKLLTAGPADGVITVISQGVGTPTGWNVPDSPEVGPSDVRYLKALITRLVATTCADPDHVVLAGLSDGSDMAVTAACALPNLVDGVLLVAASTGPSPSCRPQHVVQVHGTADPIDAYTGRPKDLRRGFGAVKAAGAERAFALWSNLDGCPSREVRNDQDLHIFRALECRHGSVMLIAVQGGGHTWPSATPRPELGRTTTSLDTRQLLDLILGDIGAQVL